jgi:hypothetical protein
MLKQIGQSDRVSIYSLGYLTHLPIPREEVCNALCKSVHIFAFFPGILLQHEPRASGKLLQILKVKRIERNLLPFQKDRDPIYSDALGRDELLQV